MGECGARGKKGKGLGSTAPSFQASVLVQRAERAISKANPPSASMNFIDPERSSYLALAGLDGEKRHDFACEICWRYRFNQFNANTIRQTCIFDSTPFLQRVLTFC